MSTQRKYLCRKGHKYAYEPRKFTELVVNLLRANQLSAKMVSEELDINYQKVRSWYYDFAKISAYDFILMRARYDFLATGVTWHYDFLDKNFTVDFV